MRRLLLKSSGRGCSKTLDRTIRNKIDRLKVTGRPTFIDLFSGCGGLSLGYVTAGFQNLGAVEIDPLAARSHARNFFGRLPKAAFDAHAQARDITTLEPDDFLKECGCSGPVRDAVDVVIGGPPCQSFARVGRAKLREVADHPEAFLKDPRSNLYLRFLHYVKVLYPLAIMMENVPDVLNHGGHNVAQETCELLAEWGYKARYTLLNAVYYGVPQMRERMFLIALHEAVDQEVTFPVPTHWIDLPRGYEGSRKVALKHLKPDLLTLADSSYVPPPPLDRLKLRPSVTAKDALSDLPPITAHLKGLLKRGARRFDTAVPYATSPGNPYQEMMRSWTGFEARSGIFDHVIRYLPRDYKLFRRMNAGDQYPEAYRHAVTMFNEQRIRLERKRGTVIEPGSAEYQALWDEFVPPYDPNKFPNKWRKMEHDKPSRTLMAHLGKDCYSHIHYDSDQARTISVREGARLQSFPDGFVFEGTMNPALRQIGNAVPPVLALAIARHIMGLLLDRPILKSKGKSSVRSAKTPRQSVAW